ncbi:MAG: glycosyltransferase family 39 protein [Bacteroidales bacterium]|nr:glycosyltransferase family 39 protein [Bacteroidales bacterium]MCF8404166.1 glycosyltransferase family 39 protein [Bacteroidales bacterium]
MKKSLEKPVRSNFLFLQAYPMQLAIIILTVFLLYGNTIFNKYSIDDQLVVTNESGHQKGIRSIPGIFTSRYTSLESDQNFGYRPIVLTVFAIEYEVFGNNPYVSHTVNILLYMLDCFLLFLLLKRMLRKHNSFLPVIITLIWAAHPLHTEVVASLKNRDELLSLASSFFTLFLFLKYADTNKFWLVILGVFSYFISFLSKPTALPFLVLIPLVLYFFTEMKFRKIVLLFFLIFMAVIIARFGPRLFLEESAHPRLFLENPIRFETFWVKLSTGFYILLFYLKKLIYPFPLLYYYGYNMIPVAHWNSFQVIFSLVLHLALFVYALTGLKQKSIFSFVLLFYLVSIAMYANVVRPVMGIVGDRFMLTPSIAICILFGILVLKLFRHDIRQPVQSKMKITYLITGTLVLIIPYSVLVIHRNQDWKNYETLVKADIKYLGNSAIANVHYADILKEELLAGDLNIREKKEQISLSISHYKRALEIYPENDLAWNNLGSIYFNMLGKNDQAFLCIQRAHEIKPDEKAYLYSLAVICNEEKDYDQSLFYLNKYLLIDSLNVQVLSNLAQIQATVGDIDQATSTNIKIIDIDPTLDLPYQNLGDIAMKVADTSRAIYCWEKAAKMNPQNKEVCLTLGDYFKKIGNKVVSQYYYKLATLQQKTSVPTNRI